MSEETGCFWQGRKKRSLFQVLASLENAGRLHHAAGKFLLIEEGSWRRVHVSWLKLLGAGIDADVDRAVLRDEILAAWVIAVGGLITCANRLRTVARGLTQG
ncbi:MAG: hypothetical protein Q4B17_04600 [Lautropia sp.]|nr:hypothetical protein [Lautropia sp.]